jgi:hypothetical protein
MSCNDLTNPVAAAATAHVKLCPYEEEGIVKQFSLLRGQTGLAGICWTCGDGRGGGAGTDWAGSYGPSLQGQIQQAKMEWAGTDGLGQHSLTVRLGSPGSQGQYATDHAACTAHV